MKYLLDSNVCVDYLTGRHPPVTNRIQSLLPGDLCLSSIVVAELRYGADKSARPRRNHHLLDVLINEMPCRDFDSKAASIYGRIRAALEKKGSSHRPQRHAHRRARIITRPRIGQRQREGAQQSQGTPIGELAGLNLSLVGPRIRRICNRSATDVRRDVREAFRKKNSLATS